MPLRRMNAIAQHAISLLCDMHIHDSLGVDSRIGLFIHRVLSILLFRPFSFAIYSFLAVSTAHRLPPLSLSQPQSHFMCLHCLAQYSFF